MKGGYKAKICGTTNLEDVRLSADESADFFGVVVEVDFSSRSLTVDDARPLFAEPPIPGVALVFKMQEERIATMIQALNPFAVQFLDPADTSMLKRMKRAYPSVEMWQSIHLPQAGQEADIGQVKKTVMDYVDGRGFASVRHGRCVPGKDEVRWNGEDIRLERGQGADRYDSEPGSGLVGRRDQPGQRGGCP